jgi:hypothetical protein
MKKIIFFLILGIAVLYFLLMNEKFLVRRSNLLPNGHIVYAGYTKKAAAILSMDLKAKKIKTLHENTGLLSTTSSVSKIDDDWILFGMESFGKDFKDAKNLIKDATEGKRLEAFFEKFVNAKNTIVKLNIKTGEVVSLRRGSSPLYMSAHNKILFLLFGGGDLYGLDSGLYIADANDASKAKFITECPTDYNHLIKVSDSEVVFLSHAEDELSLYDIKTDKTTVLPIKNCPCPDVWRDKTKQLICYDREKNEYFLTSLDNKRVEKLPFEYDTPVLYIPEKDKLIMMVGSIYVGIHGAGEVHNLWVYDFATGKKELLSKYNGFRAGNGIYLPE